jgi:hypothetical protein
LQEHYRDERQNRKIKPTAHQADVAKLPRALAPLIERPQWCIWRWAQLPNGKWQMAKAAISSGTAE